MKRNVFLSRVKENILLFDGAMGTRLFARGLKAGEVPEKLNLVHPDWVEDVHREYLEAGAGIVTTNSFGGSRYKLEKSGLKEVYQINFHAASLARKAVEKRALVAGSVGPTGEFLTPLGKAQPEEMREGFRLQIKALMDGGADLIIIETMTALEEISLAVEAGRALGDFPIIACMTFDRGRQGFRTMMGVDIPSAVRTLVEKGADGVGSNCGHGINDFIDIVREMRPLTDTPIIAEANAGIPYLAQGKTVYPETPDDMAQKLHHLLDAGADIVGGCCGTTPEHIRKFSGIIKTYRK